MLTKSTVARTSLRVSAVLFIASKLTVVVVMFLMCGVVAMAQGHKYGLFVGINQYPRPDEQLFGAVNDATKLRQKMIKDFGFAEDDTTLLTDAAATRKAIIDGITSYRQKAKSGDLFLFTYSGHGTLFPDASSSVIDEHTKISMDVLLPGGHFVIPPDYYDSAIVPVDSDDETGGRPWKNLILDDEFHDLFSAFQQKGVQVIFLADECNAGTIGKGENGTARVKFITPMQALNVKSLADLKKVKPRKQRRVAARSKWGPYLILSASKDNEFSLDVDGGTDHAGGLFTRTLLTVLDNVPGPLTYTQLLARVQPEVVRLSRLEGNDQTPQLDTRFGDPNLTIFSFQPVHKR